jgi:hypothetical protein
MVERDRRREGSSVACDTGSVIRVSASACIDAAPSEVWARLARLEEITLWSEAVVAARCEGARTRGIGAERTCDLRGGITIRERWLAWDEGQSFTYEGVGIPLVASATNEWTVHPEGEQTLLVSRAEVALRGGFVGRLIEPIVGRQISRVASQTLAAFKYLVEHGEAPPVRHAKLPRVAPAC